MSGRTAILATAIAALLFQLASALPATPTQWRGPGPLGTLLPKLLLWNASASAPRGLYSLHSAAPLRVGELVAVMPPEPLASFAAARDYLPLGVPLLKHIAALGGQTVCRSARHITIDRHAVAIARARDSRGRLLPRWQGCRTLRTGEAFLLNATVPDSFDGRYFGVTPANTITARAEPLWIKSEP